MVFSVFRDSDKWEVHVLPYKSTGCQSSEFSIPNVYSLKDVCNIMAAIYHRQCGLDGFYEAKMAGDRHS